MRLRFLPAAAALAIGAAGALSVAGPLAPAAPLTASCAAAGSHHAAIVVEHGDGTVLRRCVAFDGAQVTAEELLQRSNIVFFSQSFGSFGDAICAIDGEPAHYASCLGKGSYWAFFVSHGGGPWTLSSVGISTEKLGDGDAEGFRYEAASGAAAAPPSPAGVCAATPAATTTPTRPPTAPPPTANATHAAATSTPASSPATSTAPPGPTVAASPSMSPSPATPETSTMPAAIAAVGTAPPSPAPTQAVAGATDRTGSSGSGGPDPGLLVAALVAGGLVGLGLMRALANRRPR